jgi:mannose-1-phosphate guanylyltransferase
LNKPRAMVLAAGLGTRLRPLTDELPKPLVPLGDRPVLAHIARRLSLFGFDELVVNTHHLPGEFDNQSNELGAIVHWSHEPRILGTAGGVAAARPRFGPGPIVVWNGDIIVDAPVDALVASAVAWGIAFVVSPRPRGAGTVGVGADGGVVRLRGETFAPEAGGGDYLGVAALGDAALRSLPGEGCLIGDVALPLLRRGGHIATVAASGPWFDVGSLEAYHAASLHWLAQHAAGRAGTAASLEHAAGEPLREASWVHPTATIESGVTLRHCVVGAGAVVSGEGTLRRAVVWPHARASAPNSDCIVTTRGRLVPVP